MLLAGAAIVIVVAIALIYLATGSNAAALLKYDGQQIPASMYSQFNISNSNLQYIGIGSAGNYPIKISSANNLTVGGKPAVVYQGAEFCPFCAAERWPMIIALSRFGTFSGLKYMSSDPNDPAFPNTPTFSFANATYSSPYISFVSVEFENQTGSPLQTPTPLERALAAKYNSGGGIPFIVFANQSYIEGATYSPQVLYNMDWNQVFTQLENPNSSVSEAILGSANLITAQICKADNNQPANVCDQTYIKQIQKLT